MALDFPPFRLTAPLLLFLSFTRLTGTWKSLTSVLAAIRCEALLTLTVVAALVLLDDFSPAFEFCGKAVLFKPVFLFLFNLALNSIIASW